MISENQYEQSGLVEKLDSRALVSALRLGYLNIVYYCWNTAAVARPQSSSPYVGKADVLDCRGCRSRLPSDEISQVIVVIYAQHRIDCIASVA